MLSFKIKDSSHQTITKITKYLCYLGFIGAIAFFGYTMVTNYQEASTILSDSVIIDADLAFDDITYESGRKGRSNETYHFTYSYEADGQAFEEAFTTSESNADKYIDLKTIQVAYSKSNPSLSGKLEQLEKNSSISSLAWRGLLALFGLMFLAYALFMIITAKLFVNKDKPVDEGD